MLVLKSIMCEYIIKTGNILVIINNRLSQLLRQLPNGHVNMSVVLVACRNKKKGYVYETGIKAGMA